MKKIAVGILVSTTVLAACDYGRDVKLMDYPGSVSPSDGYAFVNGRWKAETVEDRKSTYVPPENSVSLFCVAASRKCFEALAVLSASDRDALPTCRSELVLHSYSFEYDVISWTTDRIVASAQTRATDIRLDISLLDRVAERGLRETSARGATGVDPRPHLWTIRDSAADRSRSNEGKPK